MTPYMRRKLVRSTYVCLGKKVESGRKSNVMGNGLTFQFKSKIIG